MEEQRICPKCGMSFDTDDELKEHDREEHDQQ
jgi:hypothetical protein